MKSIKEKAIEVFPGHCNATTDESNFNKRIGFNSGANYVLECIEDIIVNNEDNTLNMARCLVDCIEQLKKK